MVRWKNHADVVELPEVELFPGRRVRFHFSVDQVPNLPVEFVNAYVFDGNDARGTYARILEGLKTQLGEGQSVSAANTIAHQWTDGEWRLSVMTWPPELNTWSTNAIAEKDPSYLFETHISVTQASATFTISESLLQELEANSKNIPLGNASFQFADSAPTHKTRTYFWKNPRAQALTCFFAGKRLGYIGPRYSLILEKSKVTGLTLVRLLPARGSGASYVRAILEDETTTILNGRKTHDCDEVAQKLAEFWNLTLDVQDDSDD